MQINDLRDLHAGNANDAVNLVVVAMRTSNEFCRFAADCLKFERAAEDETHRAVFLQMARVWVTLAQKEETSVVHDRGEKDKDLI